MNECNINICESDQVTIKFKKTHPDAILPKRNHDDTLTGDVGFDLFAVKDTRIPSSKTIETGWGETVAVIGNNIADVGITVADITPGYWFRIEARSGLGFSKGIQPHFGVIDNPYRGDLGVKLYNLTGKDVVINKGQACAQLVVYKMINTKVEWADEISETERGAKGFGSSDKE